MKKVLIIGVVASGKTTLAKKISKKLNIPWYELDCIVYQKTETGKYKRTPEQQVEIISDIDKKGPWIFEGVLRESYKCLLDMTDAIIFIDTPLWKRKIRIFLRFLKQQVGIEKCDYKSDIEMLKNMYKWTRDFECKRDGFESLLQPYKSKVIRLYSNKKLDFIK